MTEQELREKLNRMTGEIPTETHRAFLSAALSGKEEKTVKRKITASLILAVLLGLAVIGTAYALITSQTAEFFGLHWNQQLGERLQEEGKIARIGESVTVGDIVITLDEIVYRDRSLYGVGTARPVRENDILVTYDMANDPEWFVQSEEAQALVRLAKENGRKMLTAVFMPELIGVDQGTMLRPGCIGYYDIRNDDGTLTFSFEASDGFVVSEGTEYMIELEGEVYEIDENGNRLENTTQRAKWTVSCTPVFIKDTSKKEKTAESQLIWADSSEYTFTVPNEYRETGVLPVYEAQMIDFMKTADPAWFNQSGIQNSDDPTMVRFNDHAVLGLAPEALYYSEFEDNQWTEAASSLIVQNLWVRNWEGHQNEFTLEKTELSALTLKEAQAQAEALLNLLGLGSNCFVCTESLDVTLPRIRAMGEIYEEAIRTGKLLTDDNHQPYNYAGITEEEEGFFLRYLPDSIDKDDLSGRYSADFYVNARGIVFANVRSQFALGREIGKPESLLSPEEAIEKLQEAREQSIYYKQDGIGNVKEIGLTYEPVRGGSWAEGMIFAPTWYIYFEDSSARSEDGPWFALINALDGTLIDASFR